ncbi:MAG: transposase [Gammaproteobacteria bacterium]|nr:transposase [Gammaproteobacteria bacterium]
MARPLRLEFAGALYHITSRGDRREGIFLDDEDRENWIDGLANVCSRFNWVVHAYCQMTNHYHLLAETVDGNLARGMRQLNGHYTQRFNRRHGLVGHLLQGRYKAILVQKDAYLLELSRYVVLNPVRARMAKHPEDWPWSSYCQMIGIADVPKWLNTDWLLRQFGGQRQEAVLAYRRYVMEGKGVSSPLEQTRHQLLLGDDSFVAQHRQQNQNENLRELSKAHRRSLVLSLDGYRNRSRNRDEAMAKAYLSGAYTMAEIGCHFGVHYMTVSRAVKKFEGGAAAE